MTGSTFVFAREKKIVLNPLKNHAEIDKFDLGLNPEVRVCTKVTSARRSGLLHMLTGAELKELKN